LGFSGQEDEMFGKYFIPLINLRIEENISQISREIGSLEIGVDLIISAGWFMVEHPMSFKRYMIPVQKHICDPELIISYDETLLDDEEMVWGKSLSATKAPNMDPLMNLVPHESYQFMDLFGEPLAEELPPHQTFNPEIRIKEGKDIPFGPIYYLSEKELGALRQYLDHMLAQGKITESDTNMAVPIIFVPKLNEKLCLCVNYQDLHAVTIKDPYPLPLMYELRD
jgi:hypothetical protein